jgi:flavin-dependent dehydrogenase
LQAEGDPATLDGEIKEVQLKINAVEDKIGKVVADLEKLPREGLSSYERARKEERLQRKEEQLREEKIGLREEKIGLQKKQNLLLELLVKKQDVQGTPHGLLGALLVAPWPCSLIARPGARWLAGRSVFSRYLRTSK